MADKQEQERPIGSLTYQNKLILTGVIGFSASLWYLASFPEAAAAATYYAMGGMFIISGYVGHALIPEWVNLTRVWRWNPVPLWIQLIIVVIYLVGFLFIPIGANIFAAPNVTVSMGVPLAGEAPALATTSFIDRFTFGLFGFEESLAWFIIFLIMVTVIENLSLFLVIPGKLRISGGEYLHKPQTYIRKYQKINFNGVVSVTCIAVVFSALATGSIVSAWHTTNYTALCEKFEIDNCQALYNRAENFGSTSNLIGYACGSIFVPGLAHFLNNFLAEY